MSTDAAVIGVYGSCMYLKQFDGWQGVVWQGVINRVFESLSIGKVAPLMCAQMKVVTLGIIVWLELRGCFF